MHCDNFSGEVKHVDTFIIKVIKINYYASTQHIAACYTFLTLQSAISELKEEIQEQSKQSLSVITLLPTANKMSIMMESIEDLLQ